MQSAAMAGTPIHGSLCANLKGWAVMTFPICCEATNTLVDLHAGQINEIHQIVSATTTLRNGMYASVMALCVTLAVCLIIGLILDIIRGNRQKCKFCPMTHKGRRQPPKPVAIGILSDEGSEEGAA